MDGFARCVHRLQIAHAKGVDDDFAGVHADTELEFGACKRRVHIECRAAGPERMLLIREGSAEHCHQPVAGDPVYGSAVALHCL